MYTTIYSLIQKHAERILFLAYTFKPLCQLPWQTTNNWVVGDHIYYTQQQVNYNKRHKHIKTNTKTRQIDTKKKIQTQSRPILQNLNHIKQSYEDLTMFYR